MMHFAQLLAARMTLAERQELARLLIRVRRRHESRTDDPHPAYLPQRLATSARHGVYSSNLVLMTVLLASSLSVRELFPESADCVGTWNRHCLLWRSALDEQQWTDFALAVAVRRTWSEDGSERDLEITFRQGGVPSPEPTDVNWLYRYPQGHGGSIWTRTYWHDTWHKMSVAGGTNDSVARRALDPLFATLGPPITTFVPQPGKRATSMAHDLMQLLVAPAAALSSDDRIALYQRLVKGAPALPQETNRWWHGRSAGSC